MPTDCSLPTIEHLMVELPARETFYLFESYTNLAFISISFMFSSYPNPCFHLTLQVVKSWLLVGGRWAVVTPTPPNVRWGCCMHEHDVMYNAVSVIRHVLLLEALRLYNEESVHLSINVNLLINFGCIPQRVTRFYVGTTNRDPIPTI